MLALVGCGEVRIERIEEANFAAAYASAYCAALTPCCSEAGQAPASSCETAIAAQIQAELDAAEAAGAVYDASAAGSCVETLEAPLETCPTWKTSWAFGWDGGCERIFTDKPTPHGSPCTSRWECADGAPLAVGECWDNQCELVIRVGVGEDCTPYWDAGARRMCALPLICDDTVGTCQPLAGLGEPCVTGPAWGDTCEPGAVCDRKDSKTCVPAKKVGETCSVIEEDCEGLHCEGGTCQPILLPHDHVCE